MGQLQEAGILFSDIAGSSRLYEDLGDAIAQHLVEQCCALQKDIVEECGGIVVKTIGDEVMAAFPKPEGMFDAATAMQRETERMAVPSDRARVRLRIGGHFGPVLSINGDYFGETVNTAAHLARIAKAEQIVTTQELADRLDAGRRLAIRDIDHLPVKGRSQGLHAVEVMWREKEERTVFSLDRPIMPQGPRSRLRIEHFGEEWTFDGSRSVTIGRDPGNDIVVLTGATSRKHATIELRGDKWVLVDRSANGTIVRFGARSALRLHCEETILHESGTIGMGQDPLQAGPGCVTFSVLPK
ncbi:MAG TPA: adenylate/guanylate cyclase domain-containing protein [Microvirga sp.]|jgi:class 3 adenylate cyclase|nr:adenylate/guanylate cyclase domain-containing protein [Microvirga sp.]